MYYPASLLNLNPIKHIWKLPKDRVYVRKPRTSAKLRQYITEKWGKITVEDIQRFTNTMHRRCRAVIDAKGGPTKY